MSVSGQMHTYPFPQPNNRQQLKINIKLGEEQFRSCLDTAEYTAQNTCFLHRVRHTRPSARIFFLERS